MCKKFKFDHPNKWYMHNSVPILENDTRKLLWDFDIRTDHLISDRRPDLIIINKKKRRISKIIDFAIPADHWIKLQEYEKKDKYLYLARELKKLWNMKVTMIPIVIGAFGTVTKGLQKRLEDLEVGGRVENIQTTTLLRSARILRWDLETRGDLLTLKLQWKSISWRWCKKTPMQIVIIIIIIIIIINKKKRTCQIVDFTVRANHRVIIKKNEKRYKYVDFAREVHPPKLWNMKVTERPIIIGALGPISKGRRLKELEIGGRSETIQTAALLKLTRILRRVLETWGDLLSFKLQWKTIS